MGRCEDMIWNELVQGRVPGLCTVAGQWILKLIKRGEL